MLARAMQTERVRLTENDLLAMQLPDALWSATLSDDQRKVVEKVFQKGGRGCWHVLFSQDGLRLRQVAAVIAKELARRLHSVLWLDVASFIADPFGEVGNDDLGFFDRISSVQHLFLDAFSDPVFNHLFNNRWGVSLMSIIKRRYFRGLGVFILIDDEPGSRSLIAGRFGLPQDKAVIIDAVTAEER